MVLWHLDSFNQLDALINEHEVVILNGYTDWCEPCKIFEPVVKTLSDKYTDAYFVKFNIDLIPELSQVLKITAMPAFIVFKDGKKVKHIEGAKPEALTKAVLNALRSPPTSTAYQLAPAA